MRIPSFSRQSEPDTAERPATTGTAATTDTSPVRPRHDADATTATDLKPVPRTSDLPPAHRRVDSSVEPPPPPAAITRKPDPVEPTAEQKTVEHRAAEHRSVERETAGPRPRSSFLATLGLILAVASVLLVLSGPLLGYGIGVAGVALVLSLAGVRATGKRHVAGKTDALLGMILSLGAIVLGVLALTGSLSWLGTDVQPVNSLREWLDTQFVDRF